MGKADKILRRMQNNPRDWRIEDVNVVAGQFGLQIRNPRGSHVVLFHTACEEILSIPAHRPIKPIYIRRLIGMIDKIEGTDD